MAFREPAALKRLTKSLESAQDALGALGKETGRDVSKGASSLYKDLKTFVASARRDTGKLGKALQRDFDQAQKKLTSGANGRARASARSGGGRGAGARSARAKAPARRASRGAGRGASKAASARTTRRAG